MIHYFFLTQKPHHIHQYKENEEKKHIQKQTSTIIQLESTKKIHRKLQIDNHKAQKRVNMKKVKMKTPSFHL